MSTIQPIETMPKTGDFIVAVWEGDWSNPRKRLRFYQASAATYPMTRPIWGQSYRTEEGEAYQIAGWVPLPTFGAQQSNGATS